MVRYLVSGWFESDRPLSDDELAVMHARLEMELVEPVDMDSERVEWVRHAFELSVVPAE